jgi:hypothetical protein
VKEMLRYWLFSWVNNILPDQSYLGKQSIKEQSIKDIYEKSEWKMKKQRKYTVNEIENNDIDDDDDDDDGDMSPVNRWRIYLLICAIEVASRSPHQSSSTIIDIITQFYFSWKRTGGISKILNKAHNKTDNKVHNKTDNKAHNNTT